MNKLTKTFEICAYLRKHGLKTWNDAIVHFGELANLLPETQEFRQDVLAYLGKTHFDSYTYYAVYLCGDELPTAMFMDKDMAEEFVHPLPRWMNKEIKPIDLRTATKAIIRE